MKEFIKGLVAIGALYAFYQGGYMVGCVDTVHAINKLSPEDVDEARCKCQEVEEACEQLKAELNK